MIDEGCNQADEYLFTTDFSQLSFSYLKLWMRLCENTSYSLQKTRIQSLQEITGTTVIPSKIKQLIALIIKERKGELFLLVLVAENSLTA